MRRRSFFVATFLFLGIVQAGITAESIRTGVSVGYLFGIHSIIHLAMAGGYQVHPEPIADPDEPAPREWFVLAGLIALVLVGSAVLLVVVVG